ncbi:hypothetical protein [Shewanella surugensis]|uniref:Uncharacterized protein n=1 Tax=Shewanella surugensis TaxID=212020 RepID=A0ABT0LAQ2_9GAMM|nr:hypothetical protein [Shewanella surugensis]MCL1124754.1 hypothetical protein [Shewanella surugensis]
MAVVYTVAIVFNLDVVIGSILEWYELVSQFRLAIEVLSEEDVDCLLQFEAAEALTDFPIGSCGVVSNLLAYYLSQLGFDAKVVSASLGVEIFYSIKTFLG